MPMSMSMSTLDNQNLDKKLSVDTELINQNKEDIKELVSVETVRMNERVRGSAGVDVFSTKDLGLAAYAKVKGLKLVEFDGRFFKFECGENYTKTDLEIDYANSCCRQHDASVMCLRQMLNVPVKR